MFKAKFERTIRGVSNYEIKEFEHLMTLHNYLKDENELIRNDDFILSPVRLNTDNDFARYNAYNYEYHGNDFSLRLIWIKSDSTTIYHREHFCAEKLKSFFTQLKEDIDTPIEYGEI